jgi:hypothetical protein
MAFWVNREEVICNKKCYTMGRESVIGVSDDKKDVSDNADPASSFSARLGYRKRLSR